MEGQWEGHKSVREPWATSASKELKQESASEFVMFYYGLPK